MFSAAALVTDYKEEAETSPSNRAPLFAQASTGEVRGAADDTARSRSRFDGFGASVPNCQFTHAYAPVSNHGFPHCY